MHPNTYKYFKLLCEALMLSEDSALSGLLRNKKGGDGLLKYLHSTLGLPHNAPGKYNELSKVHWYDVNPDSWVLFFGKKGSGAVIRNPQQTRYEGYIAVASNDEGVQVFKNDRGGNLLDFLKTNIGTITRIYQFTSQKSSEQDRIKTRRQNSPKNTSIKTPDELSTVLLVRFAPIINKMIDKAEADIKGTTTSMVKSGAYDKAEKKISLLKQIQKFYNHWNDTVLPSYSNNKHIGESEEIKWLKRKLTNAIVLAAHNLYSEHDLEDLEPGDRGTFDPFNNVEIVQKLIADLSGQNPSVLSTVMGYFREELLK